MKNFENLFGKIMMNVEDLYQLEFSTNESNFTIDVFDYTGRCVRVIANGATEGNIIGSISMEYIDENGEIWDLPGFFVVLNDQEVDICQKICKQINDVLYITLTDREHNYRGDFPTSELIKDFSEWEYNPCGLNECCALCNGCECAKSKYGYCDTWSRIFDSYIQESANTQLDAAYADYYEDDEDDCGEDYRILNADELSACY